MTLHEYLASQDVPGHHRRRHARADPQAAQRRRDDGRRSRPTRPRTKRWPACRTRPRYGETDLVREVSTDAPYEWTTHVGRRRPKRRHVVVVDNGVKYNIMRLLATAAAASRRCLRTRPRTTILGLKPDGDPVLAGPGRPAVPRLPGGDGASSSSGRRRSSGSASGTRCSGRAFGAKTFKLKFGHRGANHPVKDLATGRVHITAQNHGYAVDPDGLSRGHRGRRSCT